MSAEASDVGPGGAAAGADLGDSSKYSRRRCTYWWVNNPPPLYGQIDMGLDGTLTSHIEPFCDPFREWMPYAYHLAFQLSSHPYPCTCQIRKQSNKKCLSLTPKYEKKYILFFIFGGSWGPLCRTHVNENFRAVRPHHAQIRHMYNKGKT